MEDWLAMAARIGGLLFAVGAIGALAVYGTRAEPHSAGWRHITPARTHKFTLMLGLAMTGLMLYVWLFVGSSRPDAAQQMRVLFFLIIGFGGGSGFMAWQIRRIRQLGLRWSGRTMAYCAGGTEQERSFDDITAIAPTLWGSVEISFRDGTRLRVDPTASGARELLKTIAGDIGRMPA
jgi:hypothetical protein